jgi:putative tricarboxylic transport membrane protein
MELGAAFLNLMAPAPFALLMAGLLLGIFVGALPGMTGGMLLALTLPFTYYMTSANAVTLLIAMYVGGVSGGLITATLMRIPGEPSSVMTMMDGYPMARQGRPGRALGLSIGGALVGGALSWIALVTLSPPLARAALLFGPFENFAIVLMALILIAALSQGSFVKGLMSGLFGMLVSYPGVDETSGQTRLTFGIADLNAGFNNLPVILGAFALSQLVADAMNVEQKLPRLEANMRGILLSARDYVRQAWNILRSSLIGIWIGILPGVGATISSLVSYSTAKAMSKTPEKFGTGFDDGIVAVETANNATTGGTLIPIITLGIGGGLTDSVLLAALIIHNLQPGPMLFVNHPEVVNTLMATHLLSHVMMYLVMVTSCLFIARLMYVHRAYILPVVLVFCVVGSFAANNRMFDVWTMIAFGAIGFFLEYAKAPLGPFVIGLVLAPLAEGQLRAGLMSSDGSLWPMVEQPIALAFLVVSAVMFIWPFWREWRRNRALDNGGST